MKKFNLLIIFFFILINNFIFLNVSSEINNFIVVKVGQFLVTNLDVENEIRTNLILNKKEITQENINNIKNFAIKNLISKSIKKNEINRYEVKNYNKKDLQNFIEGIAKNLNTDRKGLKEFFKKNNMDYELFVESRKIELLWNSLIFELYKNETNINIVEVDNELEKIKKNQSEEELKKIKKNILNKRKEEKFELFSRSHFSNLENTTTISFQ
jgi:hypothetical protein